MERRFNIEFWDNLFSHCDLRSDWTRNPGHFISSCQILWSELYSNTYSYFPFTDWPGQGQVRSGLLFLLLFDLNTWVGGWLVRSTTIYCRQRRDPILCDQGQYKQPYCHRDASYYNKHKHSLHSTGFGLARSNQIQIWQQLCLHVLRSNIYTNRDQFAI